MTQVDRYHWSLWAQWRGDAQVARMRYPSSSPFYTPPRRKPDEDDGIPLLDPPTDEDYRIVQAIDAAIRALEQLDAEGARGVIEWFGAYPGAPRQRGQRIARMGVNPRAARHFVDEHVAWVDGWVACYRREVA